MLSRPQSRKSPRVRHPLLAVCTKHGDPGTRAAVHGSGTHRGGRVQGLVYPGWPGGGYMRTHQGSPKAMGAQGCTTKAIQALRP